MTEKELIASGQARTTEKELIASGQALIAKQPPKADPYSLMGACFLLCVINRHKMDWSDALCFTLAWLNIGFFVYRSYRYRKWDKQCNAWLEQKELREKT